MRYLAASILVLLLAICGASKATASNWRSSWVSWYGPGLYGNHLSCGGFLSTRTWGVAHKWLPCGTRVTICYYRCVSVPVIDRGPFVAGREFDLTYPVKAAIGMGGLARIRWHR